MPDNKKQGLVFNYDPITGESNFDVFKDYHEAIKFYNSIQEDFPNRKHFLGTQVQGKVSTHVKIGNETIRFGKNKK